MGRHFREIEPMCRAVRFLQTVVFCAAVLMVAGICVRNLQAQDARPIPAPSVAPRGIPQDWSNRHVIYTRNGSFEDMVKVRDDPRFINSVRRWNMQEHTNQAKEAGATGLIKKKNSKVDWSVSLGHFAGMAIGETPAKYTFDPTAPPSCGDFVVFTIDAGTHVAVGTQANLVGITNLYSGSPAGACGARPTFLFSYAIGSNGSGLSPVLSLDGTEVAWVETPLVSGNAILHVTTWAAGQGSNATVNSAAIGIGSSDIALDYTNPTVSSASCPATTSSRNTNSDLYVDYANDAGYIGANNGILYHIAGIFGGTPTVDFCVSTSSASGLLGAAVYDSSTSQVFISDPQYLYSYTVGASSFTLPVSYQYGSTSASNTVTSGPLLDSFNGFVYMFSAEDAATGHTSMTQLPTSMASNVVVPLGPATSSTYPVLFNGAFDNNYLTNGPAVSGSTLYTCGTDSTNTAAQDLFAIGFHVGTGVAEFNLVMKANANVNPGGENGICSPITEFYDGTTDRIFVGMGDPNYANDGFGANVVTMWDVTHQLTSSSATPTAVSAADYFGGTTGFPIDNNASGTVQAESIYFSTLAPIPSSDTFRCFADHFCAVKLTQSALQ
jgi:hypothetical protein